MGPDILVEPRRGRAEAEPVLAPERAPDRVRSFDLGFLGWRKCRGFFVEPPGVTFGHRSTIGDAPAHRTKPSHPRNQQSPRRHQPMGAAPPRSLMRDKVRIRDLAVAEKAFFPSRTRRAMLPIAAADDAEHILQPGGDSPLIGCQFAKPRRVSTGLARRRPAARQWQVTRDQCLQDHRVEPRPQREAPEHAARDRHPCGIGQPGSRRVGRFE